jgi:hypothetical protein
VSKIRINIMDREEFKIKAKKSLDESFAKIEELESKRDEAKANVKDKYDEELSKLKEKKDDLPDG